MLRYAVPLILSLAPLPGQALTAPNGLTAVGSPERIEVFARIRNAGSAFFCAAGEFARRELGAGATDRLTLTGPLSPSETRPGQRSVIFRLSAPERRGFTSSLLLWPHRPGASLTVAHAQHLCNDFRDGPEN